MSPRDLKSNDGKQQISAILSQWLPLAPTLLKMIVDELPPANALTAERAEKLMCSKSRRFDTLPAETQKLKEAFLKCGTHDMIAKTWLRVIM